MPPPPLPTLAHAHLRSFVIPIARAAGGLKRLDPDANEEVTLYRTMLDLIKPKLVYLDLPLFMALLSDLFPGVELPPADGGLLRAAIELDLRDNGLQVCVCSCLVVAGTAHSTCLNTTTKPASRCCPRCLARTRPSMHSRCPSL